MVEKINPILIILPKTVVNAIDTNNITARFHFQELICLFNKTFEGRFLHSTDKKKIQINNSNYVCAYIDRKPYNKTLTIFKCDSHI